MPPTIVRSVCPYDCPDACGMLVTLDGDRAIAVRGEGRGLDLSALLTMAGVAREVRGGKTNVAIDVTMRGIGSQSK